MAKKMAVRKRVATKPDYAYKNIEEFEEILGYKVLNTSFIDGWNMARMTNKMFRDLAKRSGGRMTKE